MTRVRTNPTPSPRSATGMLDHFYLPVLYAKGLLDRISGEQPYDKEDASQISTEVAKQVRKLMAEVA